MRVLSTIFLVLVIATTSIAQKTNANDSFTLLKTYTGDIADVAMDNLDNLYLVSSTGQIKKFSAAGDSVGVYNQLRNF